MGRGDGRGQRVPQAVELLQRQYARPPGPARHLRARQPPRDAHGVRRDHHGRARPLRRQAAQLAERRRGQVGRLDLVHRSPLRDPEQLRGPHGARRAAHQRVPRRRPDGRGHGGDGRRPPAQWPVLLARRAAALRRGERRHPARDPRLRRLRRRDARSSGGRVFVDCGAGIPDGFRCDTDGNLWCGWGGGEGLDGVAVFNPAGVLIGRILLPERCANLCFGGAKRNRLFMAGSQSVYSVYVNAQGATLS